MKKVFWLFQSSRITGSIQQILVNFVESESTCALRSFLLLGHIKHWTILSGNLLIKGNCEVQMEHGKTDSTGARNVETSVLPEIENTNQSQVPCVATLSIGACRTWAMYPINENITIPPNMLVRQSPKDTIILSLQCNISHSKCLSKFLERLYAQ